MLHKHAKFIGAEGHFAGRNVKVEQDQQHDDGGRHLREHGDFKQPCNAVGQCGAEDDCSFQHKMHTYKQRQYSARSRLPEIKAGSVIDRGSAQGHTYSFIKISGITIWRDKLRQF